MSQQPQTNGRRSDRRYRRSWRSQLQILVPLLVVWLGGFGVLGAVVAHGNMGRLFLDPSYINGGVWYDGLVSQLGIIAWTIATASAAWSAWIAQVSGRNMASRFLFHGAFVSAVLLVDDLFGFHSLVPNYLPIPKFVAEAIVLTPLALWLLRYWSDIQRTRYPVLLASLGASGLSVLIDAVLHPGNADTAVLYEDGPKFLGILAWATYFVLTTYDIARSAMAQKLAGASIDPNPSPRDVERLATPSVPILTAPSIREPAWVTSGDGYQRT